MHLRFYILTLLFIYSSSDLDGQRALVNAQDGNLYSVDINGCSLENLGRIGNYTDIAFHPDGNIYGINGGGSIFRHDINTLVGQETAILPDVGYVAMTADSEGNLFCASSSGALYSYNPFTSSVTNHGNIGFGSAGDLTFYEGTMYMATDDGFMISVYPDNPSANEVIIDFQSLGTEIWGIVSVLEGCEIQTYASSNGSTSNLYKINWEDRTVSLACFAGVRIFGGTSTFEFLASDKIIGVDEVLVENTLCDEADVTATLIPVSIGNSVEYSLDGINFQSENVFEFDEFGEYVIYLQDDLGCMGKDSFVIGPGALEVELNTTTNSLCTEDNGTASISVDSKGSSFEVFLDGISIQDNTNIRNIASGDHDILVRDSDGCESFLEFVIDFIPSDSLSDIEVIGTSCGTANGQIIIEGSSDLMYRIDDTASFSSQNEFNNLFPGAYLISTQDSKGCITSTSAFVDDDNPCNIYIPNAFSPNSDGINDFFWVKSDLPKQLTRMAIYDRWGNLLFESGDTNTSDERTFWDGYINGQLAQEGVYGYVVTLEGVTEDLSFTGSLTLLR